VLSIKIPGQVVEQKQVQGVLCLMAEMRQLPS